MDNPFIKFRILGENYRAERPTTPQHGCVVIHDRRAVGWVSGLTEPQNWSPGCFAVDVHGNVWVSRGGNIRDGAKEWAVAYQERYNDAPR